MSANFSKIDETDLHVLEQNTEVVGPKTRKIYELIFTRKTKT